MSKTLWAMAGMGWIGVVSSALGQGPANTPVPATPAKPPAGAPAAAPRPVQTIREVAARQLTRLALTDLRFSRTPGDPEFAVVADTLAIAHELQPDDQDILRLLIEAANQAGDQAAVGEYTRRLLKLDKNDTVAQLGLISYNISKLQNADERVAAYEQFLGPQGASLDPSIRSRLALDCALLHREFGDADGYTRNLSLAAKLDPTNKEAASLVATLVATRGDPADRRLESLILLLMADPLDPATHLELARELAASGGGNGALRFYRLHRSITEAYGQVVPTGVVTEQSVQRWLVEGPSKVVTELAEALTRPRKALQESIEKAKAAGAGPDDLAKLGSPRSIRLQPDLEQLLLMAASAAGDENSVRLALGEMTDSFTMAEKMASDPSMRSPGLSQEDADRFAGEQRAAILWCRLLVGQQTEEAEKDLGILRDQGKLSPEALQRFEGWLLVRKNEPLLARAKLGPVAQTDPLARLGDAAALEAMGDRAAAGAAYAACAAEMLPSVTGAWARTRASVLQQHSPEATEVAKILEAMARGIPDWIDQLIDATPNRSQGTPPKPQPRLIELVAAKLVEDAGGPLEKVQIELSIQNMSPIPLALGSEKTINSRFMIAPIIRIGARKVPGASGEVVSLERRLRLMPREEIRVRVWADPGYAGFLSELAAGEMSQTRWRLIQGFRLNDKGTTLVGPFGVVTETSMYIRQAFQQISESAADLAKVVQTCPDAELPAVLGTVRWRLFKDENEQPMQPAERQLLSSALSERYAAGGPDIRMLMLAMLPPGSAIKGLVPFDAAVMAIAETDSSVAALRVVTRVSEKDSKALDAAEASPDARLQRVARAMRARLTSNPRTFSRFSFFAQP